MRQYGFSSPRVLLIIGLGIVLLGLFVCIEKRAQDPIVDLTLFKNRLFSSAMGALFLVFMAAPPYILLMPFYLIQGHLMSPSEAGILMAVTSVITIFVGPASGSLSDRFGPFLFSALGAGATAVAYYLMLTFNTQTPIMSIIPALFLLGIGIGSFHPPNSSIIMGSVAKDRLGTTSALIATVRHVGMSVGMAVTSTLFSARMITYQSTLENEGVSEALAMQQSVPAAFHDMLIGGIGLQCIVFLLCLVRGQTVSWSKN